MTMLIARWLNVRLYAFNNCVYLRFRFLLFVMFSVFPFSFSLFIQNCFDCCCFIIVSNQNDKVGSYEPLMVDHRPFMLSCVVCCHRHLLVIIKT